MTRGPQTINGENPEHAAVRVNMFCSCMTELSRTEWTGRSFTGWDVLNFDNHKPRTPHPPPPTSHLPAEQSHSWPCAGMVLCRVPLETITSLSVLYILFYDYTLVPLVYYTLVCYRLICIHFFYNKGVPRFNFWHVRPSLKGSQIMINWLVCF